MEIIELMGYPRSYFGSRIRNLSTVCWNGFKLIPLAQASMEMTPAPPEAKQMQQPATDWAQQIPVGRIDLLASSGEILDSEEYMNEDAFLSAVQENSRNDTPMGIVLYRNADGNTISGDFLRDLNKMPESFRTEDYVQKSDWSEQIPVGRIDYLSNSGGIQQRVEYTNEADFLRDIQETVHTVCRWRWCYIEMQKVKPFPVTF